MAKVQIFTDLAVNTLVTLLKNEMQSANYMPFNTIEKIRQINFDQYTPMLGAWHNDMIAFLDFVVEAGCDDLAPYKNKGLLITEMLCQACGFLLTEICGEAGANYTVEMQVNQAYFENLIDKINSYKGIVRFENF